MDTNSEIVLRKVRHESITIEAGLDRDDYEQALADRIYELHALCAPVFDEFNNASCDREQETVEVAMWAQDLFFKIESLVDEARVLIEHIQTPPKKANGEQAGGAA